MRARSHTFRAQHGHSCDPYGEPSIPGSSSLLQTRTHTHGGTPPPIVQGSYLLCGWLWPLAQGPSSWMYHQSFKAIKHFSMRIARSSLSKTERSDSQSHFLPNPIKGGEGRGGEKRGWRLKMEGFYLRTMRYYRPDYSWLMFLVWEITFPLFFFWSAQALESEMRITLSLSCFSLLHFNGLYLFLLLCFARKISVFHVYCHLLSF